MCVTLVNNTFCTQMRMNFTQSVNSLFSSFALRLNYSAILNSEFHFIRCFNRMQYPLTFRTVVEVGEALYKHDTHHSRGNQTTLTFSVAFLQKTEMPTRFIKKLMKENCNFFLSQNIKLQQSKRIETYR